MACRCCVTNCNRNYNANNKVKTVRLLRDPDDRNRWRAIIPRDNIPNKKGTVIRPQCLIMWNPVLSQLCYKLQELGTKKVWVKHDHDRLALFSERDKVYSLKSNKKVDEFAITSYVCGEIMIIQSRDFLPSSAVPRSPFHINKCLRYQSFHVGIKCTVSTLLFDILVILKLLRKKMCYSNKYCL